MKARELPVSTDVVIVGAGPTGLALGCVLAAAGHSFLLVDRLAEGVNTSRAAVVHSRTLEVLEELEVTGRLKALGHTVPQFTLRDRDRLLARIPFDRLPTAYPHTLMIPQNVTEGVLLDRLRALGGDVLRGFSVCEVRQDAEGASVTVASADQERSTIRARYVVGADGMHSTVREHAGIGFEGAAYAESFVLADVVMSWPLGHDQVMLFVSPQGLAVVAPLPGEDRYRVVATVDDAPDEPSTGLIQALLDARGPSKSRSQIRELLWSSRFRVHHRLADRYRAGRFLIAGDAAHVHSPAGGQGMNTGIQDGVALGHVLDAVLAGRTDESGLDEYERTRRPIAKKVVAVTDRMTKMATLRGAHKRAMRNFMIGLLSRMPPVRRRLAMELAGLA